MDEVKERTVLSAEAKLTLSLRITGVRGDGYHLVDAEMVSLDLADTLTFSPGEGVVLVGPAAAGIEVGPSNLVSRALEAVDRKAHVVVDKAVPAGAGLGGGSADAAAVLRWAGCRDLAVASGLGADVAFCLAGGRARVTGIGEVIEPLAYQRRTFTLLIPPVHVSTPAVYAAWNHLGSPQGEAGNDLEPAAMAVAPELAAWRDRLAKATGLRPRLAGSGSTWFVEGAFPGENRIIATTTPALPAP